MWISSRSSEMQRYALTDETTEESHLQDSVKSGASSAIDKTTGENTIARNIQHGPSGQYGRWQATHLVELLDPLRGILTPAHKYYAAANAVRSAEVCPAVFVNGFYNSLGKGLPAFTLVRVCDAAANCQCRIQKQNARVCPSGEVPKRRNAVRRAM